MKIGILSMRGRGYHPNRRLFEASALLGHHAFLVDPTRCIPEIRDGSCGLRCGGKVLRPDVLLPRLGATIKDFSVTLIRHAEESGIRVINGHRAILLARNKFLTLQRLGAEGLPVPDTCLVTNRKNLDLAVSRLGGYPVVVKTVDSRQGMGVALLDSPLTGGFIIHTFEEKRRGLMVQRYIPPEGRADIRAFVLGGRVAAAVQVSARRGEFRANVHLGGRSRKITLPESLERLAVSAARALGLEIAGVDLIVDPLGRPWILEVNYSPGFRGLEASTGLDIASHIIRHATEERKGVPWKSPS